MGGRPPLSKPSQKKSDRFPTVSGVRVCILQRSKATAGLVYIYDILTRIGVHSSGTGEKKEYLVHSCTHVLHWLAGWLAGENGHNFSSSCTVLCTSGGGRSLSLFYQPRYVQLTSSPPLTRTKPGGVPSLGHSGKCTTHRVLLQSWPSFSITDGFSANPRERP